MRRMFYNFMARYYMRSCIDEYRILDAIKTPRELQEFQETRLKNLIMHSSRNVPYYQKVFNEIGLTDGDSVDLSKFSSLPILTRDIVKTHEKELISKDYQTRKWHYTSSGGSTGEPLRLMLDDTYSRWEKAVAEIYHKKFLGIERVKCKEIVLWGSERDIFHGIGYRFLQFFINTRILNSFRMTDDSLKQYIDIINHEKPDYIRGYANSLLELCNYIEKHQLTIFQPKVLASSAEMLYPFMREKIEKTFGTKIFDFYGSREVGNISGECSQGLMHMFNYWNYLEILDENNKPVKEGEEGRIIVTSLHNYSMPFIRYEIGDRGILGPEKCTCGSILPTLSRVTGRSLDYFKTRDGTLISAMYFTRLLHPKVWVKKFQVIQEDFSSIRIYIVPSTTMNPDDKTDIENKIRSRMGSGCSISWEIVDEIPKTTSGKYRYVISKVK